jgi:hypothetical protein
MSIRTRALSLRLAAVMAVSIAVVAGGYAPASATTGRYYHGDDYMYLWNNVSYNDSVTVCNIEYDGHAVWADYYSYSKGYQRLWAGLDGYCVGTYGNGDEIYQYRICEDTVGCNVWVWTASPNLALAAGKDLG